MKKRSLFAVMIFTAIAGTVAAGNGETKSHPGNPADDTKEVKWVLSWSEDFNAGKIDERIWSRIPRGTADWQNHMSSDERCYALSDGTIKLYGIVNDDTSGDKSPYLTGGIYTKGKKPFSGGLLEIKAKFNSTEGAWPALWLLPYDPAFNYKTGGEIDIMEHLNFDGFVYQTVHSTYTLDLGIKDNPPHTGTARIDRDGYNIYGVELDKDYVAFYVNGILNHKYPRIKTDKENQFPFDREFYLLMDMQLGGSWVGEVDPSGLPAVMEIDWVRFYKKE